jgi:hypothetical protein
MGTRRAKQSPQERFNFEIAPGATGIPKESTYLVRDMHNKAHSMSADVFRSIAMRFSCPLDKRYTQMRIEPRMTPMRDKAEWPEAGCVGVFTDFSSR